jgi:hypothetical protein
MAAVKRKDDRQSANADDAESQPSVLRPDSLREWIEGCRVPTCGAVGPQLVSRSADNVQGPWIPPALSLAATESSPSSLRAMAPLLTESEIAELRSRWNDIQAEFVDDPRRAVLEADKLVASALQRLAEGFAKERATLEEGWASGDSDSTESLRIALRRYRAFFTRLINAA